MAEALLDANYTSSFAVDYAASISPDEFSGDMEYVQQVGMIALALFVSGVVAVVLFWLGLSLRLCVPYCRGMPEETTSKDSISKFISAPWNQYRIAIESFFYGTIFLALAVSTYTVVGTVTLSDGVDEMSNAVNRFGSVVDDLVVSGDLLYQYGVNITVLAEEATVSCPYITLYQNEIRVSSL